MLDVKVTLTNGVRDIEFDFSKCGAWTALAFAETAMKTVVEEVYGNFHKGVTIKLAEKQETEENKE